MANRLQKLLASFKSRFNDTLFGNDSGRVTVGRSGRTYPNLASGVDWANEVGELYTVPAVQACLSYKLRNLPQAPPCVEAKNAEGEWEGIADHPLVQLLNEPNDDYDYDALIAGIIYSYDLAGNAYLVAERDIQGGLPTELYWIPSSLIKPKRDKETGELYYEYKYQGKTLRIPREDVAQVKFGVDPLNPLMGLSPLASAGTEAYQMTKGAIYGALAMKNSGLVGTVISPKDLPPEGTEVKLDPQKILDKWNAKTTGDRAGEPLVWDIPLNVQYPGVSPQNMAIDTMLDRPEGNIAALLGLPPQVVGLHVGRLAKTYANMKEAREAAWEECLLPMGISIYGQIGRKFLPQMSRNADRERLTLDVSHVRPLQPDLDLLYKRANETWAENLIDRAQWKIMVGMKPLPGDKGVYKKDTEPEPVKPVVAVGGRTAQAKAFIEAYAEEVQQRRELFLDSDEED